MALLKDDLLRRIEIILMKVPRKVIGLVGY